MFKANAKDTETRHWYSSGVLIHWTKNELLSYVFIADFEIFFFEKGFFRKREQPTNYLSVFDHWGWLLKDERVFVSQKPRKQFLLSLLQEGNKQQSWHNIITITSNSEPHSEPYETSKIWLFAKTAFIFDVWQCSEHVSLLVNDLSFSCQKKKKQLNFMITLH